MKTPIEIRINAQLRRELKEYFNDPRAIAQNEAERRAGLGKGTLSKFLKGAGYSFTYEIRRKLYSIIHPAKFDKVVIAGKIRERLLLYNFSEVEISDIAALIGSKV